jgi:hypothetical protein
MSENYETPEFDFSIEKSYFEPLSKIIPFDKVKKVLCLSSESPTEGEFELVHILSDLADKVKVLGKFVGHLDGVIVHQPINSFLNKAYLVEILEPGMTSVDVFIIEGGK